MNRLGIHVGGMTTEEKAQGRSQTGFCAFGHMNQVSRCAAFANFLADGTHKALGGSRCGHGLGIGPFRRLTGQHQQAGVRRNLAHDRMKELIELFQTIDAINAGHIQNQGVVFRALSSRGDHSRAGAFQFTAHRGCHAAIFRGAEEHLQACQRLLCVAGARALEFNGRGQANRLDDIAQRGLAGQA